MKVMMTLEKKKKKTVSHLRRRPDLRNFFQTQILKALAGDYDLAAILS